AATSPSQMRRRLALFLATIPLAALFVIAAFTFMRDRGFGVGAALAGALPFLLLTYGLGLLQMAAPVHVAVGADGVLVRWVWQRRFIPIAEVASAQAMGPKGAPPSPHRSIYTRLTLRSGES